jgi:hypothetical protein
MDYTLDYRDGVTLTRRNDILLVPLAGETKARRRVRSPRRRTRSQALGTGASPKALQQQLLDRAVRTAINKRARFEPEAANRLRDIVQGTVEHVFRGETRAMDDATVFWIKVTFIHIDFLVAEAIRQERVVTVEVIEGVLKRFCPLPPIC